ncbi:hypothetical protein SGQ83_05820 [Flavobacterium sp. Fl-318]|uniref:Uncharacterized protein n=1 Tax=Flavobacterium cupriresistens TaxID=2893885 RepID=A0ABU4R8F8_9FLAO|nr:hypothetical protein [Flavobacterium sp. Fl-318]MDX6188858.1 hypothetical protein [Flavobacterium sp. Fl-318]
MTKAIKSLNQTILPQQKQDAIQNNAIYSALETAFLNSKKAQKQC